MLVFISWSGEKSRYVAEQLRTWLKDVLHNVEPWVSSEDIRQGARWGIDVADKLEKASFGILCVTADNAAQPWLMFEAGALAKAMKQSHVCPYLIDLKTSDLRGPLVQFQAASASEEETRKLVHSVNKAMGTEALPDTQVDRAFAKWWPDLEDALTRTPAPRSRVKDARPERELIEELLDRVRFIGATLETGQAADVRTASAFRFPMSLFEGTDVQRLAADALSLGKSNDPNAVLWSDAHVSVEPDRLDGMWSTRWNGGKAVNAWAAGVAQVKVYANSFYAVTHDGRADCLVVARLREGRYLHGRYINLATPSEVLPWAGIIVDDNRIDGLWSQGRWDFRRGSE